MKTTYRIALIDDGINDTFFPNIVISNYKVLNHIVMSDNNEKNNITHATICLGIFLKYIIIKNFEVISIKILDETHHASAENLNIALKWLSDKEVDLINLSIGTSFYEDEFILKKSINDLYYKNTIIIAAQNNNDFITYPACYSNVIGVRRGLEDFDIMFNPDYEKDGIQICAKSHHKLLLNNKEVLTQKSNSFATPYVSALVLNFICNVICQFPYDLSFLINSLCSISIDNKIPYFKFDWCLNSCLLLADDCSKYIIEEYLAVNILSTLKYEDIKEEDELLKKISISTRKNVDTLIIVDYNKSIPQKDILKLIALTINNLVIFRPGFIEKKLFKYCKMKVNIQERRFLTDFDMKQLNDLDIPIICLMANENNVSTLLTCLIETRKKFYSKGYNCKCISNFTLSTLYDIETIETLKKQYVDKYINFHNIDLFLVGIVNVKSINISVHFDVEFNIEDYKFKTNSLYYKIVSMFNKTED